MEPATVNSGPAGVTGCSRLDVKMAQAIRSKAATRTSAATAIGTTIGGVKYFIMMASPFSD